MLKVKLENSGINTDDLKSYQGEVDKFHEKFKSLQDDQKEFLGWNNWTKKYKNSDEYKKIKVAIKKLEDQNVDTLVVIGIGGSYLGAKAGIDFVLGSIPNTDKVIYFAGINMSPLYLNQLRNRLKGKNWGICVISKSGTTLEPALAFRILKDDLISQKGEEKVADLIIAVTDGNRGTLKDIADKLNLMTFVIPDNIGGRYSVFTPVGLVPLLFMGVDIDMMFEGANLAYDEMNNSKIEDNPAYTYALSRYLLSKKYSVELFCVYEPNLQYFAEWWKQLFGESEGKEGKGLFPASVTLSADLHSLGQFIQEGTKLLFETVIWPKETSSDIVVKESKSNEDNLNYVAKKSMHWINEQAFKGVLDAHSNLGDVKNIILEVERINAKTLGYLFYFFMKACAMSASMLGVDPFNQPGVEAYKKSMFKLLGKK